MRRLFNALLISIINMFIGTSYADPICAGGAEPCASSEIDVLNDCTQCETSKFQLTTTNLGANGSFNFWISAKGTFYVDCGDGGTLSGTNASGKTISKTTSVNVQYSCSWSSSGAHTIKFGGIATGYSSVGLDIATTNAAINFGLSTNQAKIASISGSLSAIFPQLGTADGEIPHFNSTFDNASNLISIPTELFSGLTGGSNAKYMFYGTFSDCTSLTSIPEGLFKDITDAANSMFSKTFEGCTGLTGYIAPTTFAGLTANNAPTATTMWYNTFYDTQLATTCPNGLPQYITGYEGNANNTTWNGRVSCGCMPGFKVENGACVACEDKPENSSYLYNPSADSCPWACDTGYSLHENLCLAHYDDVCPGSHFYDITLDACTPCPTGYTYNNEPGKRAVTACQIQCLAGTYVDEPGVYGYTRLEYLESNGGQYIDTGYVHNSTNIRGEIRVGTTQNITSNVNILGNQTNSKTGYSVGWDKVFKIWVEKDGSRLSGPTHPLTPGAIHDVTYEFSATKRWLTYDHVTVEGTHSGGVVSDNTIHLFDNGIQQTVQNFKGRIYYIKIYEDNILVHNFIPVSRDDDGAVGIIDTVTGDFFENSGTGSFTVSTAPVPRCVNAGYGYYAEQQVVNFGSVGTHVACPTGKYSDIETGTGPASCKSCTGATYNDWTGQASCKSCPTGFTYDMTSEKTDVTQCKVSCGPGTYVQIPTSYTQVQYIQSSGSQYINTGINVKNLVNPIMSVTMQYTTVAANKKSGAAVSSSGSQFSVGIDANSAFSCSAVNSVAIGNANTSKHTFVLDTQNGTCSVDSATQSLEIGNLSTMNSVINLGRVDKVGSSSIGKARYYNFNLISNNQVIMNLVPVRRESDGVLGMYDTINNGFYPNAGSGTFTAGSNVARDICIDVGEGYWAPASIVNYGSPSAHNACASGLSTQGYGHGADEVSDCGRKLHFGNYFVYSKSGKDTTPSINIKMNENDRYYISLSPTDHTLSKLHMMYNGQEYTAYDDGLLHGERNPTTGARIQ